MDFNNPRYYEETEIAPPIKKINKMNNAIAYLEANSHFEEIGLDSREVVDIVDAHHAVYLGMVEVLNEVKATITIANNDGLQLIDQLINKYKKKL